MLAADVDASLAAIRSARAQARAQVWQLQPVTEPDGWLVIDLDATLVDAHSEKEGAQPTFKRGFGFCPLLVFADHGLGGTGECLAAMLRPGKANANNAADHITVLTDALAQLPEDLRGRVVVRGDSGAGTHRFVEHLDQLGLGYSVGLAGWPTILDALENVPRQAWKADRPPGTAAPGSAAAHHRPRRLAHHGLRHQPARPHRRSGSPTPAPGPSRGPHPVPERHRTAEPAVARLRRQPDLARTHRPGQRPARLDPAPGPTDTQARTWKPKRLRFRLLHVAGRWTRTSRREWLRLPRSWPWNPILLAGHDRLTALST